MISGLKGDRLTFIDTYSPMLNPDGQPRAELFQKDNLHMNAEGYKLWTSLIKPRLK
jgi:lysophospholipase L1-like esterase